MQTRVFCFGEVLVDRFPDRSEIGGAPFNVAYGLSRLGTPARMISAVGPDTHGCRIVGAMTAVGMDVDAVQRVDVATGTVVVRLNHGDASYEVQQPAAWDFIRFGGEIPSDAWLYFGTLAQRSEESRETLLAVLNNRPRSVRTFCDLNLRPTGPPREVVLQAVRHADVLKLNAEELQILSRWGWEPGSVAGQSVVVTRGAEGARLWKPGQQHPLEIAVARCTQLVNTVGAGDAFSAMAIHSLVQSVDWEGAIERALVHGAAACERRGATDLESIGPGWDTPR